jgi:hypothetical protein
LFIIDNLHPFDPNLFTADHSQQIFSHLAVESNTPYNMSDCFDLVMVFLLRRIQNTPIGAAEGYIVGAFLREHGSPTDFF